MIVSNMIIVIIAIDVRQDRLPLFLKDNCSDDDIFEYESQMPNLKWKCQALDWSLAAATWDAHGSWEWKRLKNCNVRHRMQVLFLVSLEDH